LTSSNELFVATADLSGGWQNVSRLNFALLDMATGSKIASYPVDARLPPSSFSVVLTAAEQLVFVSQNNATAVAVARKPSADAEWPSPSGGADNRRAARGR